MNQFVEFTRQGPVTYGPIALRVNQIKAIEKAPNNDTAMVVLFEKANGYDYYWTAESYTVIRDRLTAAQEVSRDNS